MRLRMVRSALVLALLTSTVALADDVPRRMSRVAPGHVVTSPAWLVTDEGKARIDATLQRHVVELEQLRAENAALRTDFVVWQAKPALTLRGALLLVAAGAAVGVGATIAVV